MLQDEELQNIISEIDCSRSANSPAEAIKKDDRFQGVIDALLVTIGVAEQLDDGRISFSGVLPWKSERKSVYKPSIFSCSSFSLQFLVSQKCLQRFEGVFDTFCKGRGIRFRMRFPARNLHWRCHH